VVRVDFALRLLSRKLVDLPSRAMALQRITDEIADSRASDNTTLR
jgi:hypothetical protein